MGGRGRRRKGEWIEKKRKRRWEGEVEDKQRA